MDTLGVSPSGADRFEGHSPDTRSKRIFGGLVVAQALLACCRTVEGRAPHSLHAYFILAGDPAVPLDYAVERLRDGRSFATRRCVARQHDKVIFDLTASFHAGETGLSHQAVMPVVKPPEELSSEAELAEQFAGVIPENLRRFLLQERSIELRHTDLSRFYAITQPGLRPATRNIWVRAKQALGDDPAAHQVVLAYLSDMTLLDCALAPLGRSVFDPALQVASLDHALWFHRPFRADDWLLYSQDCPNLCAGRGLARGLFFSRSGSLVASVVQEGLIRERR